LTCCDALVDTAVNLKVVALVLVTTDEAVTGRRTREYLLKQN